MRRKWPEGGEGNQERLWRWGNPGATCLRKKVVSDLGCCQAKATGFDPTQHPSGFGQRSFHCPEGLEQDQKGQPDTGLGRGDLGRRGWRREGGCFQKEETGVGSGWGVPMQTASGPGGRIRFKQYVSVGLSCH